MNDVLFLFYIFIYHTAFLCTVQYLYVQYSIFMYSAVFFYHTVFLLQYSICVYVQYSIFMYSTVQYFFVPYSDSCDNQKQWNDCRLLFTFKYKRI